MAFVLNTLVDGTKILASKLNENFEGLQGDISDNYTELDGRLDAVSTTLGNIQGTLANVLKGTVIWFSGDTAPSGYLICNGSAVSRTEYADLFSVIGTTFGDGNGETTFNLPDLVTTYTHIQGSTTVGTEIAAGLPSLGTLVSGGYDKWGDASPSSSESGIFIGSLTYATISEIYGNSTTVQPPALTLLPCIKY